MTLEERLWKTFNKALGQYQLIDEGDRILVGLSGGKDSLCLLEFLARRSRVHVPRFTIEALHVRMEIASPDGTRSAANIHYETDTSYLQSFCDRLGVPFHLITTSFSPTPLQSDASPSPSPHPQSQPSPPQPPQSQPSPHTAAEATVPVGSPTGKKPPCFLCSWQRRKQLFNLAQQLGCTKIALGHHQDDLIHTALMNLTFHGHFSTMPAKLKMRKMPLTIIRPLCLCREEDIRVFAEHQGYEKQLKLCPYERTTHRTTAAQLFDQLEHVSPEARYNIFHALETAGKLTEY